MFFSCLYKKRLYDCCNFDDKLVLIKLKIFRAQSATYDKVVLVTKMQRYITHPCFAIRGIIVVYWTET